MHLDDIEGQVGRIAIDQIPTIGVQLMPYCGRYARRADYDNLFFPTDMDTQQPVKADEVVHVHM